MQVVIDMPDDIYSGIVNHFDTFSHEMRKWGVEAIKNGTPLPEKHEMIKAEIKLYEWECFMSCSEDKDCAVCNTATFGSIYRIIDKHLKGAAESEDKNADSN